MRHPRVNNNIRQGAWSTEEDQKLIDYINRYKIWNWSLMPKFAGLSRTGKSCRLRWVNYLNPKVKRGNITKEEEEIIVDMHAKLGSRWSKIAGKLPGRTYNEIKNYWHTHMKKRAKAVENPKLEAYTKETCEGSNNNITGNVYLENEHEPSIEELYKSLYIFIENESWLNDFVFREGE